MKKSTKELFNAIKNFFSRLWPYFKHVIYIICFLIFILTVFLLFLFAIPIIIKYILVYLNSSNMSILETEIPHMSMDLILKKYIEFTIRNNIELIIGVVTFSLGVIGLYFLIWRTKIGDDQLKTSNEQLNQATYQNILQNFASESETLMFAALESLSNYADADEKRRQAICDILCARLREIGEEAKKESVNADWREDLRQKFLDTLLEGKLFENFKINLKGTFLCGLLFTGIKLKKVHEKKVNLEEANLTRVDLRFSNIKIAYLSEAILKGANLEGVDLKGIALQGTNLQEAYLPGASLQGAILLEANLEGAILEADLQKAELQYAMIDNKTNIDPGYLEKNYKQRKIDPNCYERFGLFPPTYNYNENFANKKAEEIAKNNPRIIFPKDINIENQDLHNYYKSITKEIEQKKP